MREGKGGKKGGSFLSRHFRSGKLLGSAYMKGPASNGFAANPAEGTVVNLLFEFFFSSKSMRLDFLNLQNLYSSASSGSSERRFSICFT